MRRLLAAILAGGAGLTMAAAPMDPKPGVDWPSFRGIRGAGVADGFKTPLTWDVPNGKSIVNGSHHSVRFNTRALAGSLFVVLTVGSLAAPARALGEVVCFWRDHRLLETVKASSEAEPGRSEAQSRSIFRPRAVFECPAGNMTCTSRRWAPRRSMST